MAWFTATTPVRRRHAGESGRGLCLASRPEAGSRGFSLAADLLGVWLDRPAPAAETGRHGFLEGVHAGAFAEGLGDRIALEGSAQDVATEGHFGVVGLAQQLPQAAETGDQEVEVSRSLCASASSQPGEMSCIFWSSCISVWRHNNSDFSPFLARLRRKSIDSSMSGASFSASVAMAASTGTMASAAKVVDTSVWLVAASAGDGQQMLIGTAESCAARQPLPTILLATLIHGELPRKALLRPLPAIGLLLQAAWAPASAAFHALSDPERRRSCRPRHRHET